METFISQSEASKNALNIATLSSSLPVGVLIFGEVGTGKKSLARVVSPDAELFDAQKLQALMRDNTVNLEEIKTLIISDIDNCNNIKQFLEKLESLGIKIIATATQEKESFAEKFAVRIDILPLKEREEDVEVLSHAYLKMANKLFATDVSIDTIKLDFSKNSFSLKESIFRGVIYESLQQEDVLTLLESYLYKIMDNKSQYKDLIEVFEIPLINASRRKYKSQLQMAKALNINRNTLRKKINQYNLGED
jgi:DNA-binding NtrC family response regulator